MNKIKQFFIDWLGWYIVITAVIFIFLFLTGCATPLVHDTKTDNYPDTAYCVNKLWYTYWTGPTQQKFNNCMTEHGWTVAK